MTRPNTRWFSPKLPLAVILLSGAVLRFYKLTAHPLQWDELLVSMASRHSLTYIFNLCSTQETHPPLFYLLTKAVLLFRPDDFALRFSSALFGTLCIYILYHVVREFANEGTALLASAFLSINILHFQLSRELRPYSLQTVLFIVTLWFVARIEKYGHWKDTILLCCFNIILFSLHYFTYYLVAAQGIVLALLLFKKLSPFTFKQFSTFCIVTAVVSGMIYLFFVQHSLAHQLASTYLPRRDILHSIGDDMRQASSFAFANTTWTNFMYLIPLAGCAISLWRKSQFAVICLLLGLIPFVLVLITAPGYSPRAWHVVWVTPLLSLFGAMALSWLPGCKVTAPLLTAGCVVFLLIYQHAVYWEVPADENDWKTAAKDLRSMLLPGALVAEAASANFIGPISWYLDQSPPNPLIAQDLEPDDTPVTLQFIGGGRTSLTQTKEALYVSAVTREPGKFTEARDVGVYTFQLNRQPVVITGILPVSFVFSANPKDFYVHVSRLHNVRNVPGNTLSPIYPVLDAFRRMEDGIIATQNNEPDFLEFTLDNGIGDTPMYFSAMLQYANIGLGNRIGVWAHFDDEPPLPLAESTGPDRSHILQASFLRDKPFRRLTLHVELYCKDDTALLFGNNLRTLVFQWLRLDVSRARNAVPPKPAESVITPTSPTGTLPTTPSW